MGRFCGENRQRKLVGTLYTNLELLNFVLAYGHPAIGCLIGLTLI